MPYLRHKPTGDIYIATTHLITRADMEEVSDAIALKALGKQVEEEKKAAPRRTAKSAKSTKKADKPSTLAADILSTAGDE